MESSSQLDELRKYSTVVADTASFQQIKRYNPRDATTNPSLILQALQSDERDALLKQAESLKISLSNNPISPAASPSSNAESDVDAMAEILLALFAVRILSSLDGRVSIEVPAEYSFDKNGTVEKAKTLIARTNAVYKEIHGQSYKALNKKPLTERILIKIAATWQGIQAAKELEQLGIHCNLTLLFSLTQALKCAELGVTLISPFVGRVMDWYAKEAGGRANWKIDEDPGVVLVKKIFYCLKSLGSRTEIMAASFRNKEQILELSGCDLLTISPKLLAGLENSPESLSLKLDKANLPLLGQSLEAVNVKLHNAKASYAWPRPLLASLAAEKRSMPESEFLWSMNEEAMAHEKLADGIRIFHRDYNTLKQILLG